MGKGNWREVFVFTNFISYYVWRFFFYLPSLSITSFLSFFLMFVLFFCCFYPCLSSFLISFLCHFFLVSFFPSSTCLSFLPFFPLLSYSSLWTCSLCATSRWWTCSNKLKLVGMKLNLEDEPRLIMFKVESFRLSFEHSVKRFKHPASVDF